MFRFSHWTAVCWLLTVTNMKCTLKKTQKFLTLKHFIDSCILWFSVNFSYTWTTEQVGLSQIPEQHLHVFCFLHSTSIKRSCAPMLLLRFNNWYLMSIQIWKDDIWILPGRSCSLHPHQSYKSGLTVWWQGSRKSLPAWNVSNWGSGQCWAVNFLTLFRI